MPKELLVISIAATLMFVAMTKLFYINGYEAGCKDTYKIIYKGLNLKKIDENSLKEVCRARAK